MRTPKGLSAEAMLKYSPMQVIIHIAALRLIEKTDEADPITDQMIHDETGNVLLELRQQVQESIDQAEVEN